MDVSPMDSYNGERCTELPVAHLDFVDSKNDPGISSTLDIWELETLKIGRDPRSNTFSIDSDVDSMTSRNHFEIYVVVYEPSVNFVYVRDCKSFNGTYVNGFLVGQGPAVSPGYLLKDGDYIQIRPFWQFQFRQPQRPAMYTLTATQKLECKIFADKYVLTPQCLGRGAEAVVYLAADKKTRKQLVCKLVNLDKLHGKNGWEEVRRKFQEADVLRQMQHPNILTYIDAISSPHSLYTFTELASGGDLMSFTYRHNPVAELDARIIIRQVVSGLCYLHSRGVIHRDLKPENILLTYSPDVACHRVVLSDFGNCAVPRRSRMITNIGTAYYQAPEIRSLSRPHTYSVDMWSLGIVALILLTSDVSLDLSRLSGINQAGMDSFFKEEAFTNCSSPSTNGKRFVRSCLQIAPADRMAACEAKCHDWLCTPEKDLRVFQKLDERIPSNWCPGGLIKPMPWVLPDVVNRTSSPIINSESTHHVYDSSSHLATIEYSLKSKSSPNEQSPLTSPSTTLQQKGAKMPNTNLYSKIPSTKAPSQKVTNSINFGGRHCAKVQQTPIARIKRKKVVTARLRDAAMLPLTNLNKHLISFPTKDNREEVLRELKNSNSKFLTGRSNPLSTADDNC